MKKILITGIGGFVGKHLTRYLLSEQKYEIIGTYRTNPFQGEDGTKNIPSYQVDLLNEQDVLHLFEQVKPDYCIHLAASAPVGESFSNPQKTLMNNIVGQLHIHMALQKLALHDTRLVIITSGEMYGMVRPDDLPVNENTPFRPLSPYAVSKIAQDYLAYQQYLTNKHDIVRLRPYNHIGPGQKTGFVVADFAKQIAQIEKGMKEPIITVGNLDAKRDFTDVRDVARAYYLALEKGIAGEAYNIGSGKSVRVGELLEKLISYAEKPVEIKIDQTLFRPIEVPEIVCDTTKFSELTGWKPEIALETTLKETLDYWREIV